MDSFVTGNSEEGGAQLIGTAYPFFKRGEIGTANIFRGSYACMWGGGTWSIEKCSTEREGEEFGRLGKGWRCQESVEGEDGGC